MSISTEQFVQSLSHSGLLPAADIDRLRASLSSAELSHDGLDVARELVRQKKLTTFQARSLCEARSTPLVLGDYTVLDEIGSGGMGRVYKARHRRMDRIVALKILPESASCSQEAVRRFQREVKTAARLDHPNVVDAHDAGEDHGQHFLVLEYVDGLDLKSHVLRFGRMDAPLAINCLLQAARGLAHLHEQGVIHRDIKPANLLRDREGTVKLLDLGLARLVEDTTADLSNNSRLTVAGQMLGTADYVSPEQAEDTRQADFRSDIYSLGATLHYLLTGEPPYAAKSITLLLAAHQQQPVPSLLEKRSDLDGALDLVFRKMMAKQPEQRYASMEDLIHDLEALQDGQTPLVALASPPKANDRYRSRADLTAQPEAADEEADCTIYGGQPAPGETLVGLRPRADGGSTRHNAASVTRPPQSTAATDRTVTGADDVSSVAPELCSDQLLAGNHQPAGRAGMLVRSLLPGFIAGVVVALATLAVAAWLLQN
ncbi:MAG: serine/threonine protein kinase [Planctomycetaceae bacterium]|nr:serine/threonine protein kinase [Planctomycetaceae bacterium]